MNATSGIALGGNNSSAIQLNRNTMESDAQWRQLGDRYLGLWQECRGEALPDVICTTSRERERRRKRMLRSLRALTQEAAARHKRPDNREAWQARVLARVRDFGRSLFGLQGEDMEALFALAFLGAGGRFPVLASVAQPPLQNREILQAVRNIWVVHLAQFLLQQPIIFSPALFAYGMLYPVTDNYLDSSTVSGEEKLRTARRLAQRLAGKRGLAASAHERIVFRLVRSLEKERPRREWGSLYGALYRLQETQLSAIVQQAPGASLTREQLLRLSMDKGGSAVVCDGLLIRPHLDAGAHDMLYGLGTIFQLLDDLQDMKTDSKVGDRTLYSLALQEGNQAQMVVMLFRYVERVISHLKATRPFPATAHWDQIRSCLELLILEAVAGQRSCFDRAFLTALENRSPFPLSFLGNVTRLYARRYFRLTNAYHYEAGAGQRC